jgi:hypothetical protein
MKKDKKKTGKGWSPEAKQAAAERRAARLAEKIAAEEAQADDA